MCSLATADLLKGLQRLTDCNARRRPRRVLIECNAFGTDVLSVPIVLVWRAFGVSCFPSCYSVLEGTLARGVAIEEFPRGR